MKYLFGSQHSYGVPMIIEPQISQAAEGFLKSLFLPDLHNGPAASWKVARSESLPAADANGSNLNNDLASLQRQE